MKFAYPTGGHCDDACDWTKDQLHSTTLVAHTAQSATLKRVVDATLYYVVLRWEGKAALKQKGKNFYQLVAKGNELSVSCEYLENCQFRYLLISASRRWHQMRKLIGTGIGSKGAS